MEIYQRRRRGLESRCEDVASVKKMLRCLWQVCFHTRRHGSTRSANAELHGSDVNRKLWTFLKTRPSTKDPTSWRAEATL